MSRDELERVSRMYHSNEDASRALGMSLGGFGRACRRAGVTTPYTRKHPRRTATPQPEGANL